MRIFRMCIIGIGIDDGCGGDFRVRRFLSVIIPVRQLA